MQKKKLITYLIIFNILYRREMNLGQLLLLRYNGALRKGIVKVIHNEDLDIELLTGEIIQRKFWEVKKVERDEENKYNKVP